SPEKLGTGLSLPPWFQVRRDRLDEICRRLLCRPQQQPALIKVRGQPDETSRRESCMSTAVIAPVNPMSAEGKDTVMTVMRRDRENFTRLVSDPKNWNVDTRCTGWETRDLVGHMIDVMEGYFKNWDAAVAGKEGTALGLPVMG